MSVRVHELAKELRISTGALQKHLKDLGIIVKSHMSHLEDADAERVRALFQREREMNKKREEERRKYLAAKMRKKQDHLDKENAARKRAEAREKEEKEKIEAEKKLKTPTFIERPIEKPKAEEEMVKKTAEPTPPTKPVRTLKIPIKVLDVPLVKGEERPEEKKVIEKDEKAAKTSTESTEPAATPKKPASKKKVPTTSKKVVVEETEVKQKHLQAKLKHTKRGRKKKNVEPFAIEESEVKRNIKQTLSRQKRKRYKKEDRSASDAGRRAAEIVISEFTSVAELSKIMDIPATEIIMKFFKMGKNTTINQRLDKDSLEMICSEFNFDFKFAAEYGEEILEVASEKHKDAKEYPRPPIVTVMGHVDHGKTSILDRIRSTNVAAGEDGRITQHIGASQVEYQGNKITFLDTPGHEAFAAMRARGAHVTDIAVLVVAADDGVKQQTVEAIDHAKVSGVEIVVAINKIDLKTANIDRVIADLAKQNVYLENYGGNIVWVTCSAATGQGIDDLLEAILLVAEMQDLKAKRDVPGMGVVIEAKKDSQRGTVATILLQEGRLEKGDSVVCGATHGKVRLMENAKGKRLKELLPSEVAIVYGLNSVPKEGDILNKVDNEKTARQISSERKSIRQERERLVSRTTLSNLFMKIKQKDIADIKLIVKADTDGSVEAFCDAVQKLSNDEVKVNVIHKAVGSIVEADVNLAAASDAIIVGFHVRAENRARRLAEENDVEIKTYQIIYDGINEIRSALEGMIEPDYEDRFVGSAVVKQIFRIKGVGMIAGCAVDKGRIVKEGEARLYRNSGLIYQGKIESLKHFAADVDEVRAGTECGIGIKNFNDVKEGDIIEVYVKEAVPRTLSN